MPVDLCLFVSNNLPCSMLIFQAPALSHKNPNGRCCFLGDLAKMMNPSLLESWANSLSGRKLEQVTFPLSCAPLLAPYLSDPRMEFALRCLDPTPVVATNHVQTRQIAIGGNIIGSKEQACLNSSGCAMFILLDSVRVEDVFVLFGLIRRRWTTMPLLRVLRFNSRDALRLSSVTLPPYQQLNSPLPQVQTPDRLPGEPPEGHQLVCSTFEAFEDCSCSIFESALSAGKRWLAGSICDLRFLLHERLYVLRFVHLRTYVSSSVVCKRDFGSLSCIVCYT